MYPHCAVTSDEGVLTLGRESASEEYKLSMGRDQMQFLSAAV